MCGAIRYAAQNIYFPNPKAELPIRLKTGDIAWQPWGRRQQQLPSHLPMGGWARLESIQAGRWNRYQPQPVLIPAQAYMEKDAQRYSHWFELAANTLIQGLFATYQTEQAVYVVTIPTPADYSHIHARWPRIVELTDKSLSSP